MHHAKSCFYLPYGGADGTRTHDLCVANRTIGKTLSICFFESCSHQEKSMVFPFFPVPYHRVYVASCFFWPRIGHLEIDQFSTGCGPNNAPSTTGLEERSHPFT